MPRAEFERRKASQNERALWRYHNDAAYRARALANNATPEKRAAKRRWQQRNRAYMDHFLAKRGAQIRQHRAALTPEENRRALEFYKFRDILNRVHGRGMFEVDHKTPVSRGGFHHPGNLRLTTAVFNHRKFINDLCPVAFAQGRLVKTVSRSIKAC